MKLEKILQRRSFAGGEFNFEDVAQTQVGHEDGDYGYFIIESKRRKQTLTGTSIPRNNSAVIYFEHPDPFEDIYEILDRRLNSEFDLEASTGFIPAEGEYDGKDTENTDISEVRVDVEESGISFYCFDDSRDLIGAASIPIATAFKEDEYTDEENLQVFHAMVDEVSESFTDARESKEDTMDKVHRTALEKVERICGRFHSAAKQLRDTHSNSDSFQIENEYSVQSLLHSYLKLEFDDVRAEEYNPSYAGKQPRIDFLIEAHDIMIEVKHARPDHGKEKIREELAIDKDHYRKKDYDQLVCFIYDPDEVITNPGGFITDLEFEEPSVMVLISP
ncbi:hypothetical protein [Halobacterium salinarum]|uniref:PD-(D/E)XK nuclease domain-containing protein n=1 Tax=Halobacterium salinarum TaxID=2242 RepID=UPI002554CC77|nr:hypothetical protein [Halobacterium salinarum]MDL0123397.1 hypothetical protein [Halobacterium salinarum]